MTCIFSWSSTRPRPILYSQVLNNDGTSESCRNITHVKYSPAHFFRELKKSKKVDHIIRQVVLPSPQCEKKDPHEDSSNKKNLFCSHLPQICSVVQFIGIYKAFDSIEFRVNSSSAQVWTQFYAPINVSINSKSSSSWRHPWRTTFQQSIWKYTSVFVRWCSYKEKRHW